MTSLSHRLVVIALALIVVTSALYGAVKFTSTWAAPDAGKVSFKGQKVAALIMSDDMNLRVPAEEALARELTAKGMTGVAAYRLIPREELKDVSRAKGWFERGSVAGVVVLRPVSDDKVTEHTPDVWTTSSYSTLWGYYPYGWSTTYYIGSTREERTIVVEALIYRVSTGGLVWGGVSEATNPKSLQQLVGDIVKEAANKIQQQFR
jgi:hypothetical protein